MCIEEVNAAVQRNDYETARALTTHAVRTHRYSDEELRQLLLELTLALQPEQAWDMLMEAFAHQKHGPKLRGLARAILQENGDVRSALEVANAGIAEEPDSPRAYEVLAAAAVSMPELAKSLHESAVALAPADGERYVYLSHTLRDLGEFEDAIAAVNRAMELEQPDPAHHEALATIFFDMNDEATLGAGSLQDLPRDDRDIDFVAKRRAVQRPQIRKQDGGEEEYGGGSQAEISNVRLVD